MKKIAIIGPKNCYTKRTKIKEALFKIKQSDPTNTIIISGGNEEGIERDVKDVALDFGLKYEEFNPAFTKHNSYSKAWKGYYGKKYHYTFIIDRYNKLLKYADAVVVGFDDNSEIDPIYQQLVKEAQKKNKIITFI